MNNGVEAKPLMPDGRRSSAALGIPEDLQAPMRKRLRLMRESRGLPRNAFKTLTSGTIQKLESVEISQARLGDLYGLAVEFGVGLEEFIQYLVGKVETNQPTAESRRMQRMLVFMRSLPEEEQDLACDLVQRLVTHSVDKREQLRAERAPGVRRDGRAAVREALGEQ